MRTSPVHYIAPSSIGITPNCNGSANDLAVYIAKDTKIKVYSPKAGIGTDDSSYLEWTLTGRNRRLNNSEAGYTIYARLTKSGDKTGYLVFAPKTEQGGDKYNYVTINGLTSINGAQTASDYWYIRLGDVSLPENNQRTVTLDTGILGTDLYNNDWVLNPDTLPLRIELGCTINDEDVGLTPYVYWGQSLVLTATLVEGWTGTDILRFDHWEITRSTDNGEPESDWMTADRYKAFRSSGQLTLSHTRGEDDDFNGAVAATFTLMAMEVNPAYAADQKNEEPYLVLRSATITIWAETVEKYELALSSSVVGYNPATGDYTPDGDVAVRVRATDQRGEVFYLTKKQFGQAQLSGHYAPVGTAPQSSSSLTFSGGDDEVAVATIPVKDAFAARRNLNVWLTNGEGTELSATTIAFVRDGEDSKEREWIFLRSKEKIDFDAQKSMKPANISGGEVNPTGAATGNDTNKNQDGWVPQGWWDEMQGTTPDYPYEYGSYRDYNRDSDEWGDFSDPKPWSHYGKDGEDSVSAVCEYPALYIHADSSGVSTRDVTANPTFMLVAAGGNSVNATGVVVKSKPSGVKTLTHSDVPAIPDYGCSITVPADTAQSDYDGSVVFSVTGAIDGTTYTRTFILPIVAVPAGKDSVRLDLDNEMSGVQTDSTGKVRTASTVSTVASVFNGATAVASGVSLVSVMIGGSNVSTSTSSALYYTSSISSGKITLTLHFSTAYTFASPYKAEVAIKVRYNSVDYDATLTVAASMGNAVYELLPSPTSIVFKRDSEGNYTQSSRDVSLKIVKKESGTDGVEYSSAPSGIIVRYSTSEMPASVSKGTPWPTQDGILGTVPVSNSAASLYIAMFNSSGVLLDRETVPVVSDGEKGDDGDSAAAAYVSPGSISVPCATSGAVKASVIQNVSFSMSVGTGLATLTNIAVYGSLPTGVSVSGSGTLNRTVVVGTSATASGLAAGVSFTLTGTYNGKTYTARCTLSLIGSVQGSEGDSAITYAILFDAYAASYSSDDKSLSASFTCYVTKMAGSKVTNPVTAGKIQVRAGNNGSWKEYALSSDNTAAKDENPFQDTYTTAPSAINFRYLDDNNVVLATASQPVSIIGATGIGKPGCMYYVAGLWDVDHPYTRTDELCPIVYHNGSWWYLLYAENKGSEPKDNSKVWGMFSDFNNVITDAIFVKQFARFGSAIITGDWLISIHGTIAGVRYGGTIDNPDYYNDQEAYTWFDRFFPIGPGTSASVISSDIEATNVRRSLPSGYTSVNYQKVTDTFKLMAGRSYSFKASMRVTNSNYIGYLSLFPYNVARTAATSTTESALSASYTPAATREDYYFAAMIQYVGPVSWLSEVYDASSDACRTYMNDGNYEPVYQRSSSKPSLPTGTTAANPGNGWSTSIPDGNGTLWVAFGRMTNRDTSAKLIVSSIQFACAENDMFIPNYAVDLRTGKTYQQDAYIQGEIYATDGVFNGVVKAKAVFKKWQSIWDSGIIDLSLGNGVQYGQCYADGSGKYYLPNAAENDSVEIVLGCFIEFTTRSWYGPGIVYATGEDKIWVNSAQGTVESGEAHYVKGIKVPVNRVYRLHSIGGHWVYEGDESDVIFYLS